MYIVGDEVESNIYFLCVFGVCSSKRSAKQPSSLVRFIKKSSQTSKLSFVQFAARASTRVGYRQRQQDTITRTSNRTYTRVRNT